jgi:acyl carrier protein
VAVVGLPDEIFGEQVVAFVVPANEMVEPPPMEVHKIKQYATDKLANYKVPRHFQFIDELPRNPSGKVLKNRLREMGSSQTATESKNQKLPSGLDGPEKGNPIATRPPTLRKKLESSYEGSRKQVASLFLQSLVQSITKAEEVVGPETRFLDAGLDSMMIVEMSSQLQSEFDPELQVSTTLVFDHPRICDLADFLVTSLVPKPAATATKMAGETVLSNPASSRVLDDIERLSEDETLEQLMKEIQE